MMTSKLNAFSGKRVILLQGPPGPFFRRLAEDLEEIGATVFKINFNAGDWLFYPREALCFQGTAEEWPAYFKEVIAQYAPEAVILFGDCRPLHRVAHGIAEKHGLEIAVFEEGYVRPDYITFEMFGVNGHSRLPREAAFYRQQPLREGYDASIPVGDTFWAGFRWSFLYYAAGIFGSAFFPNYRHHRPLCTGEGFCWVRSLWRKYYYKWRERGLQKRLEGELAGRFYLVPLQVYNDAQIWVHSSYASVSEFICSVIASFAENAPEGTVLALKHHPLDRAYTDYTQVIREKAEACGVADRVLYLHDQHLPSLLRNVRGVVLVNSTVGISALHHGAPLKACGKSIYNMEGLTFQGSLDEFWHEATPPDVELFRKFRHYVIQETQLNGNFYRRIPGVDSYTGIPWSPLHVTAPPPIPIFPALNEANTQGATAYYRGDVPQREEEESRVSARAV